MWPFNKKRLSDDQQLQLRDHANRLNRLGDGCLSAFDEMRENAYELGRRCLDDRRKPMDRAPEGVEELVETVKRSLAQYTNHIGEAFEQVLDDPPAQWYPEAFWDTYQRWLAYYTFASKQLFTIVEALDSALVVEPGKHRVNMYVSGLFLLDRMHYGAFSRRFPSR